MNTIQIGDTVELESPKSGHFWIVEVKMIDESSYYGQYVSGPYKLKDRGKYPEEYMFGGASGIFEFDQHKLIRKL